MKSILQNALAILVGLVVGSAVNMALILVSGSIIPPPEGADVTTAEGLKAAMHLFEPKHFLMPFLAHALGTFVGAVLTVLIAATRKSVFAYVIGVFFLAGGIANVLMLPSPVWFTFVDLLGAYLPMAFLATRIAKR